MTKAVIDTNIFVGALQRNDGVNRRILELCFLDELTPLMGDALYLEYQSLMEREPLFTESSFSEMERNNFFDDFCSICGWIEVHYRWRPNLKDEGDNHLIELAMAGGAQTILTWNIKDFRQADLLFPDLRILTPVEWIRAQKNK